MKWLDGWSECETESGRGRVVVAASLIDGITTHYTQLYRERPPRSGCIIVSTLAELLPSITLMMKFSTGDSNFTQRADSAQAQARKRLKATLNFTVIAPHIKNSSCAHPQIKFAIWY